MLEVIGAVCGYRRGKKEKIVLNGLTMRVERGEILCILGKNGVGKTTLFRSILGGIPLLGGEVLVDGRPLSGMSARERAGRIGYVPQSHTPPFAFTVRQIVVMGRTAHMGVFASPSAEDYRFADEALEMMGMYGMKELHYTEISGGERQLALIARAIAQGSDYLIMDEPTSSLDFGNRVRVLDKVRELADSGKGIVMTTHDPEHAFSTADRVAVIGGKETFYTGSTEEVLTTARMDEIYGIRSAIAEAELEDGRKVKTVIGVRSEGIA